MNGRKGRFREGKEGLEKSDYHHLPEKIRHCIERAFPEDERRSGSQRLGEFLTGGWLEVFFWYLIEHHKEVLDIWDVRLNMKINKEAGQGDGNELDIAFMRKYTLCVVECKSGAQKSDKKGEYLYKIEAVTRQTRALHVKSYLATTSDYIFEDNDPRKGIKANLKDRTNIYNCTLVSRDEIKNLARNWQDAERVKEILDKRPDDNY